MKQLYRVKVICCGLRSWWYADKIGQLFVVEEFDDDHFRLADKQHLILQKLDVSVMHEVKQQTEDVPLENDQSPNELNLTIEQLAFITYLLGIQNGNTVAEHLRECKQNKDISTARKILAEFGTRPESFYLSLDSLLIEHYEKQKPVLKYQVVFSNSGKLYVSDKFYESKEDFETQHNGFDSKFVSLIKETEIKEQSKSTIKIIAE